MLQSLWLLGVRFDPFVFGLMNVAVVVYVVAFTGTSCVRSGLALVMVQHVTSPFLPGAPDDGDLVPPCGGFLAGPPL